jgi:regulator of protease activity HflC (stomatin/prohibitin superfamily)
LLSRLTRRLRAALHMLREWCSRHAFSITVTLLIVVFVALFFWERIFVSIYPGQVGVLWRRFGGTVVDKVYTEGLHLVFPLNIMYIYDVRWQVLSLPVVGLTRDGLEMTAEVTALYRVRAPLAGELHQQVGEAYVERLVQPPLESAIRNLLGRLDVEQLYVDRDETLHQTEAGRVDIFERDLIEHSKAEVGYRYVEVRDTNVKRLILPERIQAAIQQKRQTEQVALEHDYWVARERKEADRKRIEAEGIRDFQATITGGLTPGYLTFKRIEAILELAKSSNGKVIVFGNNADLPLLLGTGSLGQDGQLPAK